MYHSQIENLSEFKQLACQISMHMGKSKGHERLIHVFFLIKEKCLGEWSNCYAPKATEKEVGTNALTNKGGDT